MRQPGPNQNHHDTATVLSIGNVRAGCLFSEPDDNLGPSTFFSPRFIKTKCTSTLQDKMKHPAQQKRNISRNSNARNRRNDQQFLVFGCLWFVRSLLVSIRGKKRADSADTGSQFSVADFFLEIVRLNVWQGDCWLQVQLL